MRTVRVQNRHPLRRLDASLLRRLALTALAEEPIADHAKGGIDLGIVITGAAEMARVNEQHLGHEGATDVITFDYTPPGGAGLHGEILICLDVAGRQASAYRTTCSLEVLRYLVHGLLHLCGYDDLEPATRQVMKRHENRLVKRLKAGFEWGSLEPPGKP